jgi:hypothetical protein
MMTNWNKELSLLIVTNLRINNKRKKDTETATICRLVSVKSIFEIIGAIMRKNDMEFNVGYY